jgi:hypothetical protein
VLHDAPEAQHAIAPRAARPAVAPSPLAGAAGKG